MELNFRWALKWAGRQDDDVGYTVQHMQDFLLYCSAVNWSSGTVSNHITHLKQIAKEAGDTSGVDDKVILRAFRHLQTVHLRKNDTRIPITQNILTALLKAANSLLRPVDPYSAILAKAMFSVAHMALMRQSEYLRVRDTCMVVDHQLKFENVQIRPEGLCIRFPSSKGKNVSSNLVFPWYERKQASAGHPHVSTAVGRKTQT